MSAMKEDEAVKGYLLDPETHLKFLTLYTEKKFTYDFWLPLMFYKVYFSHNNLDNKSFS